MDRVPSSTPTLGLSIADAATAMGVGRRTLERWIASEALPVFRRGRVVRVPLDEIDRFRRDGTVSPRPTVAAGRRPGRGRPVRPGDRLWD